MRQLIECVPNFSEGRDMSVIRQITDEIEAVDGVKLLDVDPGEATNRTVVTFVGEPAAVCEAAFRAVRRAAEVIDMRKHHGAHPRMGATDVLPLVPVAGITLEECGQLARKLAARIADEAAVPCYCYEASAFRPERKNLAVCRRGEYEALPERLGTDAEKPDFGARSYDEGVARTGCTVVGARDFLIAVNFNLNSTSTRRANAIAFDVREKGRPVREGNPITGRKVLDADGNVVYRPGTLKHTKAIGWYIEEYGIAQVSMNMTDINATPLHIAFEEVCRAAAARGLRVTGTEIVGLVPERALMEAGRYFLAKQHRSAGIPRQDILSIAIHSLGLDDLKPFVPEEKVIEYLLDSGKDKAAAAGRQPLAKMSLTAFADETARESAAPGGGSVSAYMGALGASLAAMVANLSCNKPGWDDQWAYFADKAAEAMRLQEELTALVDKDTAAFNRIMAAFGMPKKTDEERAARAAAIEEATLYAARVPMETMKASKAALPLCRAMMEKGNPNSQSDAAVGALAACAAVKGAGLNVIINAKSLADKTASAALIEEARRLMDEAQRETDEIVGMFS